MFIVTDLNSTYGTFLVNGQRIAPNTPVKLPPHSSIYLGEPTTRFTWRSNSMRLSCFTYTNKGGRPDNEDSVRWDCQDGRGIFVLADGLGGHRSGEMASAIAAGNHSDRDLGGLGLR